MRWLAILAIHAYRWFVRPILRRRCLFDESCSTFGIRVLRERGFVAGAALIRARLRSCQMPAAACFVLDEHGEARLLSSTGWNGQTVPPKAIELLARYAEHSIAQPPPYPREPGR
jgi:putative component of membrane protein insertase Oxa1/YidC/SpoIIIJ protein YidD